MFPMELSDFKILISIESYDEKTAENYRYCYVAEKAPNFKTIEYIDPNF